MARIQSSFIFLLFVGVSLWLASDPVVLQQLEALVKGHDLVSYSVYVLLLILATVFAPMTTLPMMPMISMLFGPFTTALLNVLGWSIGAVIVFLISRYFGRPFLEQHIDLSQMDKVLQNLPAKQRYLYLSILRMTIPVDILSYALSLSTAIKFTEYLVTTVLGVVWFAFIFSYMGNALTKGNLFELAVLCGIALTLLATAALYFKLHNKPE